MPSYLVLARKYRPATFREVVGQDHVIQTLTNSLASGRVAHAFLFCGVRGVGKTTVARILAKALNCTNRGEDDPNPCDTCTSCREITEGISVDVQEIDGASHTSVENIREINENIKYPPVSSPYKIIIIDEVHMISTSAFNALLKTLEEPPSHAKFIFATTESHKVPATINSRCQRFNFRTVSVQDMIDGMARIVDNEGLKASQEALALIAMEAQGSYRDALSLLDQVVAFGSDVVEVQDVTGILGIAGRDSFGLLTRAILDRDVATAIGLLGDLFKQGYDPEQFVMDLIRFIRNLTVVKALPQGSIPNAMIEATPTELEEIADLAGLGSLEELQNLFSMLLKAEQDIKRASNPWVALEMTVIRMANAPRLTDLAELISLLDSQSSARPPSRSRAAPRPPSRPVASEKPVVEPVKPKASPSRQDAATDEETVSTGDRFVIEEVTPLPSGTPDQVWTQLKETIRREGSDPMLASVMEHGSLISFGPTKVEIGFHKTFYRDQFQERLDAVPEMRKAFADLFGCASVETLVLATPTSLVTEDPYAPPKNGQTDRRRALKEEALNHPVTRAVLKEFNGSTVEDIKIK